MLHFVLQSLQEPTYVKILEEIPDILSKFAKPANPEIYANWEIYLKAFLTQGNIHERSQRP